MNLRNRINRCFKKKEYWFTKALLKTLVFRVLITRRNNTNFKSTKIKKSVAVVLVINCFEKIVYAVNNT